MVKPRPAWLVLALWLGASRLAGAQTDYGTGGSATWTLLEGTRALALGPAALLMADDAGLLGQDPGALAWQHDGEVGLHHGEWLAGESWDQLNLRQPVDDATQLGVAAGLTNFDPMDRTDASGAVVGTYTASEALAGAGLARRWDALALGFSGLLTRQTIDQSASIGYAWAVGGEWRPSDWLGVALCYRSVTEGLVLPDWSFDGGVRLGPDDWRAAVDANVEQGGSKRLQMAGSRRFRAGSWSLELLGGWGLDIPDAVLGSGAGWTLGLTVQWQAWSLDYAFVPLGDFEPQHHLGVRYAFSSPPAAPSLGAVARSLPLPPPPPAEIPAQPPLADLPLPTPLPTPQRAPAPLPAPALPPLPPPGPTLGTEVLVLSEDVERGEALEQQGQAVAALGAYRMAVERDAGDLPAWRHLAQLYGKAGRLDYAKTCWQQVLRLAPGDIPATQALQAP